MVNLSAAMAPTFVQRVNAIVQTIEGFGPNPLKAHDAPEWAERVLEAAGAETYGGSANTAKGVRALRDALTDLGVPSSGYSPANGSGLGHQNRVAPATMADLLRKLYFDPRVGTSGARVPPRATVTRRATA